MKVRVSNFNFLILSNVCLCINFFTFYDYELHPESATFGISSEENEFPFMTAFGWINKASGEIDYLCGGMLIEPNFVLTAAHCMFFKRKLPDIIKIGGNNLNSTFNENHFIRNYFIHPGYEDTEAYDDIALVQLGRPSSKMQVCLWANPTLPITRLTAIGYGATKFAGSNTPVLQKVNLVKIPIDLCRVYHEGQRKFPFGLKNEHICAGDPAGRQDICQGDSGGPLIVRFETIQYAVGIISNGQACFGFPPSIYTRISSHIEWIFDTLRKFKYNYLGPNLCF